MIVVSVLIYKTQAKIIGGAVAPFKACGQLGGAKRLNGM